MTDIRVTHIGGDAYSVEVQDLTGSTRHEVQVPVAALDRFAGGVGANKLLEESFRFLLEREPKEAILRRFEISEIARYFPEYPAEIRERLAD
jgi:hypothetical protein